MVSIRRAACVWVFIAAGAAAQVVLPPDMGVPGRAPTVPGPEHDLALERLAAGDYDAATDLASREYRGSVRMGADRWIDSIASAALLGECLFETGDFDAAIARYEEAMLVEAARGDWLLAVQFPPQPLRASGAGRAGTWGRSRRNTVPGAIPETIAIRQSSGDAQEVLKRGGVLMADHDRLVRPQEIMRMLVVAIYRHAVLLGPLAREANALDAVEAALARRAAPPNHWSQAWIDVALGVICWAQGKPEAAGPLLTRGLVAGNQFDHALTAWGLIVLGRMALDADQPQRAAELFEEATYAAADFGDVRALEEAFALAATAHALAGTRGVPPVIARGCDQLRGELPALHARLVAIEAERWAAARDVRSASAALREIDPRLLQATAGRNTLGCRTMYARALAAYAAGDEAAGDAALRDAIGLQARRSPRLFQTRVLTGVVRAGGNAIPDRIAESMYARLLADPDGRDFALDPLDALSVAAQERSDAFATWLAVATRRDAEAAVDVAEAAVRHRWLVAQPLGGRRLAVERWIAADPRALDPQVAAARATLLGDRPELAETVERMTRLRGDVAAAIVAADPPAVDVDAYPELAARRGLAVAEIAAGRDGVPMAFPPLATAAEVRGRLEPRQLLLSFRWSDAGLVGMLESRERFATWQVRQAAGLPGEIASLAKGLCLFDADAPVVAARLAEGDWRGSAERIERMLFENSRVTLAEGIDELVIVPDGWLWYVPFELLPIGSAGDPAGDRPLLRDLCRVRYAPTRSLAVMPRDDRGPGPVGLQFGRIARGEKEDSEAMADAVRQVVPSGSVAVLGGAGVPAAVAAAACDTLVVLDAIPAEGPPSGWPLVAAGGGRGAKPLTLGEWLSPPAKRPTRVLVPGLATALAGGLAKPPPRPGDELFFASTDLLAAGAQTVVLSRWPMGGKTCGDLVTEFLRAAVGGPAEPAAKAWQRAVDVVIAEPPDAAREPRIREADAAPLTAPLHPIFWSGYMLVDCGAAPAAPPPVPAQARP